MAVPEARLQRSGRRWSPLTACACLHSIDLPDQPIVQTCTRLNGWQHISGDGWWPAKQHAYLNHACEGVEGAQCMHVPIQVAETQTACDKIPRLATWALVQTAGDQASAACNASCMPKIVTNLVHSCRR